MKHEKKAEQSAADDKRKSVSSERRTAESGGPQGLEPTRYGDWERNGRCVDF